MCLVGLFLKHPTELCSYFTSTFKRKIKTLTAASTILIMILSKEFFLIRGPAVYMEFGLVFGY